VTIGSLQIPSRGWCLNYTRTQGMDDDTYWVLDGPDNTDYGAAIGYSSDSYYDALLAAGLTDAEAEAALAEARGETE
jgi:hypothetical protein